MKQVTRFALIMLSSCLISCITTVNGKAQKVYFNSLSTGAALTVKDKVQQDEKQKDSLSRAKRPSEVPFYNYSFNYVSWQVLALAVGSYDFSYERQFHLRKRGALLFGLTLGYKPRQKESGQYYNHDEFDVNNPTRETMLMPYTESYYIGPSTKFLYSLTPAVSVFGGVETFYRNSDFDNVNVHWTDPAGKYTDDINYLEDSLKANVWVLGGKLLVGARFTIPVRKRFGIYADVYGGCSLAHKEENLFHYQTTSRISGKKATESVQSGQGECIQSERLGLCFGIKIGVRF